jgi:hypothetical protein
MIKEQKSLPYDQSLTKILEYFEILLTDIQEPIFKGNGNKL